MAGDIVAELGHLFLGTRLKRLAERMQADVQKVAAEAGLPIQPSHYPVLAIIERQGSMTVGQIAEALGISQPGVTRNVARLVELGLVDLIREGRDQRQKSVSLTPVGAAAMEVSKRAVWPRIDMAVAAMCEDLSGSFLDQVSAIERALDEAPLDRRAAGLGLSILRYSDALVHHFHDINAEWIEAMYRMEQADRDVLENPRERIIDPGGDILFVEADGLGIVGTCALRKTGPGQVELTKMGVLASARGRKAGEFLLRATIARAADMRTETLYLLSNRKSEAAIHLYEKLGFVHDAGIMREFGARYERCDVAMRYRAMRYRPAEAGR
ncbi:MAG: MarR family transcriptional regulator [Sphingomonas bacterium]|uniref:bifunctional helix-turn-helix transcriptional regulator/GNAT family N-acetyltransferase n=1 Tax=Sphingomonas bacterium TaxID=1895847 RepID=UPI00260F7886|nr:bifunctional helix-turn-helix transcriptional regulator/GNAT family N-acetyltransferase [Sphingomonas bacterium]MDB5704803.1 MarR family transcriptional regulator [Sphingomonas bacterium]